LSPLPWIDSALMGLLLTSVSVHFTLQVPTAFCSSVVVAAPPGKVSLNSSCVLGSAASAGVLLSYTSSVKGCTVAVAVASWKAVCTIADAALDAQKACCPMVRTPSLIDAAPYTGWVVAIDHASGPVLDITWLTTGVVKPAA